MVSVCIATYNGEKYIREQLESILCQLDKEDEVIISDDSSTDSTIAIIKDINDNRVKIFYNKKKGVNNNFSNALNQSKGDIIFLSDQDDIWMPNKVAVCKTALIKNELVVSNCSVIDDKGEITYTSYFKVANSGKGFLKNFFRSTYLGCCLAFRRSVLEKTLPIPENLKLFHDWWFGFVAESCFKVVFIDVPCMYYRRHSETNSNTLSKSNLSLSNKIYYRIQLLILGSIRVLKIKLKNAV